MVVARTPTKNNVGSRLALTPSDRIRFSRVTRPSSFTLERLPVILEWGSWMLSVGFTEQRQPRHLLPLSLPASLPKSKDDWYHVIYPLLNLCWDRLMSAPSSRRVIVVHPPFMSRDWECAIRQSFWDLGVPAAVFLCSLHTPPLALGWKRGMIIHIGKSEAYCLAHADGTPIENTLQIAKCGYEVAVSDTEQVISLWTNEMKDAWINESNPNSLVLAVAKCLQSCPIDVRKHVASNLVFCGPTTIVVPDLSNKVVDRLRKLLKGDAPELEELTSDLTAFPTKWNMLAPVHDVLTPQSTGPFRPDMVSWIGASLWATVWHRHDEDDANIKWIYAPQADSAS